MMAEYNEQQIREFQRKDYRIVLQAVLKSVLEALGSSGNAYRTFINDLQKEEFRSQIKEICLDFAEWIYKASDKVVPAKSGNAEPPVSSVLPEPTPQQLKILKDTVQSYNEDLAGSGSLERVDLELLKEAVLKQFGRYPTRPESIAKIKKAILVDSIIKKGG